MLPSSRSCSFSSGVSLSLVALPGPCERFVGFGLVADHPAMRAGYDRSSGLRSRRPRSGARHGVGRRLAVLGPRMGRTRCATRRPSHASHLQVSGCVQIVLSSSRSRGQRVEVTYRARVSVSGASRNIIRVGEYGHGDLDRVSYMSAGPWNIVWAPCRIFRSQRPPARRRQTGTRRLGGAKNGQGCSSRPGGKYS